MARSHRALVLALALAVMLMVILTLMLEPIEDATVALPLTLYVNGRLVLNS